MSCLEAARVYSAVQSIDWLVTDIIFVHTSIPLTQPCTIKNIMLTGDH